MNRIELTLHKKTNPCEDCLPLFSKDVTAILYPYLNTEKRMIKVRANPKNDIISHIFICFVTENNEIHVDLSTIQDDQSELRINDTEQEIITRNPDKDLLTPFVSPYLSIQEKDLRTLLLQEEELQYPSFCDKDALFLINKIAKKNEGPLAISIYRESDGLLMTQYVSDEKNQRNVMIAKGKYNMSKSCDHSSLYAYCQSKLNKKYEHLPVPEYICGAGAFPIRVNHQRIATITISGLKEGRDHDIIVETLNEILHKNVPLNPSVIF